MNKVLKRKFNIFVIIFSAIIMLVYLFAVDNPKKLLQALEFAKFGWLLCAALCMVVYWLLDCTAVKLILNGLKCKITFSACFNNTMIGQLFNCITPFASGGQPMQIYDLSTHKIPFGQASCALLAKFIVYQTALTLFSLMAIITRFGFFAGKISHFGYMIFIGLTINLSILFLLIGVGFFPKVTIKVIGAFINIAGRFKFVNKEKLNHHINEEIDVFFRDFSVLKKNLQLLILPLIVSFIQLAFYYTVPFFVCVSLNVKSFDWYSVICAASFIAMITSFIPLPGGSGGAEGGFLIFFTAFIRQAGVLAVAILIWRFFTFYFPILAGMAFTKKVRKTEDITIMEK